MIAKETLQEIYSEMKKGRALDDILRDPGMPEISVLQKHMRDHPADYEEYRATKTAQRVKVNTDPQAKAIAEASSKKAHEERMNGKRERQANR